MENRLQLVAHSMARIQVIWGFVFVVVFLITGMYMRASFPEMHQGDATMRMLFRSAHMYILFAALLNLAVGSYLKVAKGWQAGLQLVAAVALITAPVVFTAAFFFEPAPGRLDRPISVVGAALATFGVIGHFVASRYVAVRRITDDHRDGGC